MSFLSGPCGFYSVNPALTLVRNVCYYSFTPQPCELVISKLIVSTFISTLLDAFHSRPRLLCMWPMCFWSLFFFTTFKHYYYHILHLKVINKSATYTIQALTWTHQSAEPLRWPSTCDSRRIHLDPHKVFHGPRFWLAGVMLPH